MTVIDLFAGAGGWDHAAQQLGIDPIGIELDADTCATRNTAGLSTIRAVLGSYHARPRDLVGLIASPPCPSFSAAGDGRGRADISRLVACLDDDTIGTWDQWYPYAAVGLRAITHGSMLCVEPLTWIDRTPPLWIAMEQVPPVLPIWEAVARWLERRGYHTWTGILDAADFATPQNRRRAFLIAHGARPVSPPVPTHAEFPHGRLFGEPEASWVTMAEALNLDAVLDQYDKRTKTNGDRRNPPITTDKPAPTFTTKFNGWAWERPATTVQGDSRIWPPGHKINQGDIDRLGETEARARYGARAGPGAVKVQPWQAGVLQSFPPDYPWQGSKTGQARQIGNAVPPVLARHVLEQVTA